MVLYEIVLKLMNGTITIQNYLGGSQAYIYDFVVNTVHYIFVNNVW